MPSLTKNDQINGCEVVEFLGEGGMAEVYKAFEINLKRFVAVKLLRQDKVENQVYLQNFLKEIEILSKLKHNNIIRILDQGVYQNQPYFVMEYASKGTLKNLQNIPHSIFDSTKQLLPIARAINYAHKNNILHLDIKPSNILISDSDSLLLSDFGIGRKNLDIQKWENETTVFGSMAYMSPEQMMGEHVDQRSDIYSFVIVLYETVLGYHPFGPGNLMQINNKKFDEKIPELPSCPQEINRILSVALRRDPVKRFANFDDLISVLSRITDQSQIFTNFPIRIPEHNSNSSSDIETIDRSCESLNDNDTFSTKVTKNKRTIKRIFWFSIFSTLICLVFILSNSIFSKKNDQIKTELPHSEPKLLGNENKEITPPDTSPIVESTLSPAISNDEAQIFSLTANNTLVGIDDIEMVLIPSGKFFMGSSIDNRNAIDDDKPMHEVDLSGFWIDQTEITNTAFQKFIEQTGYVTDSETSGSSHIYNLDQNDDVESEGYDWKHPDGIGSNLDGKWDYPVIHISWNDANEYCKWAGKRLPTEAEWEKAARGNSDDRNYPWGNQYPDKDFANVMKFFRGLQPVGKFFLGDSPFKVKDMSGNVSEWCADWYTVTYYQKGVVKDPDGPIDGTYKVVRGGGWNSENDECMVTNREGWIPNYSSNFIGFRCAIDEDLKMPLSNGELLSEPTHAPTIMSTTLSEIRSSNNGTIIFVSKEPNGENVLKIGLHDKSINPLNKKNSAKWELGEYEVEYKDNVLSWVNNSKGLICTGACIVNNQKILTSNFGGTYGQTIKDAFIPGGCNKTADNVICGEYTAYPQQPLCVSYFCPDSFSSVFLDGKKYFIEGNTQNYYPVWSPDGQQFLFLSLGNGDVDLILDKQNRTPSINLTKTIRGEITFPAWSMDSKKIVFVYKENASLQNGNICYIDLETTEITCITKAPEDESYPSWSPDGKFIAFSRRIDGDFEIFVINISNLQENQITNNDVDDIYPLWSPYEE